VLRHGQVRNSINKPMIRFIAHEDEINESFNRPYPYKGGKTARSDYWVYSFTTIDKSDIYVKFEEHSWSDEESAWSVKFSRGGKYVLTGEGDAMRIFATVLAILKDFMKKVKPQELNFSAEKPDWMLDVFDGKPDKGRKLSSREKLYKKMIQRYAGPMGYKYTTQTDRSATDFRMVRK
jgi:hypothetical protein